MQSPYQASSAIDFGIAVAGQEEPLYATQPPGGMEDANTGGSGGLFGWISSSAFMHKVVEKTKVTNI